MNQIPEILDLLIVGGGPGGTAAAFRARELGMSVLVIEYDDLMKRIRDYSKDKLILPNFGGGDKMRFPSGGALIANLSFDPIDKDDLCDLWKGHYRSNAINTAIGFELTGLQRRPDGLWEVQTWNHGERTDMVFIARHVGLALGRGVPRRFEIPGNTDGLAFRLENPRSFVGRPSCVVGGGTSAAEAVIALSRAKAAAGDPTSVYWSYRGDKMPRVSKALAEVFFEAYVGLGNIRYYPRSEPAAVVTGNDRKEYLSLRVDRRQMEGRPAETSHLEFPKESCIACIGEDIPEALLKSLGIHMAVGGPRQRKRMVVNRYLETQQENVYLIGDILSQAYFETDDFEADPVGFREVKHRGNIKSALRDGVRVAQIVRQRLDGHSEIDTRIDEADEMTSSGSQIFALTHPPGDLRAPEEEIEAAPPSDNAAFLFRVLPGDADEDDYVLARGSKTTIGRSDCNISIPDDNLMSRQHATILMRNDQWHLRDDNSATGVFLEVPSTRKLQLSAGAVLRAGRQFLLFEQEGNAFGFTHFDAEGREVGRHQLPQKTIVLGRKAPDITLDPEDGTLSRRHLALSVAGGQLLVKDLKSANGTFIQVKGLARLKHGDRFRLGQQRFVFSREPNMPVEADLTGSMVTHIPELARPSAHSPTANVAAATPAPTAAAATAAVSGQAPAGSPAITGIPMVTFKGLGTFPVAPGQTLCEVAEANGLPIAAECHSGICGSDPLRILSGQENLDQAPSEGEAETLEDLCSLEPGPCRLACMARIRGPVEVELL